jgi:uncharacterized membrane protein
MNKVEVDFGKWLNEAFELYKANFAVLALAGVMGGLLSGVTFGVLSGPMMAGIALIVLRLLDRTEPKPQAGDLFKGFEFFLPSFLLMLCILGASVLLSLIPGLNLISWVVSVALETVTMFSIFLIVEKKLDFWPAITTSYETVKTNFWPLLALQLVASILGSLGTIACCIGVLVPWPFTVCVVAIAYRRHFGRPVGGAAPAGEPLIKLEPPTL